MKTDYTLLQQLSVPQLLRDGTYEPLPKDVNMGGLGEEKEGKNNIIIFLF